mmetsp:Transcript_22285/g.22458  ORF Transcript_22285/g.22458 Transcript_22285/m.22458 type:complete len:82 (+) Transcript_22285:272-517(+)
MRCITIRLKDKRKLILSRMISASGMQSYSFPLPSPHLPSHLLISSHLTSSQLSSAQSSVPLFTSSQLTSLILMTRFISSSI